MATAYGGSAGIETVSLRYGEEFRIRGGNRFRRGKRRRKNADTRPPFVGTDLFGTIGPINSIRASSRGCASGPRARNAQTRILKRLGSRRGKFRTKSISAPPTSRVGTSTRTRI